MATAHLQQLANPHDVVAHIISTLCTLHSEDGGKDVIVQRQLDRFAVRFDDEDPSGGNALMERLYAWLPGLKPAQLLRVFVTLVSDGIKRVYGYEINSTSRVMVMPAESVAQLYRKFGVYDDARVFQERPLSL